MNKPNIKERMISVNSAERPWTFLEWTWAADCNAEMFWPTIFEWWSSFDAIPHEEYEACFLAFRDLHPTPPCSADDAEWFESLPDEFQVYRGQSADADFGLSWSCSKTVADEFSKGHRCFVIADPIVLQLTVKKSDIAIATNDRNEQEIVLFYAPVTDLKSLGGNGEWADWNPA